MVQFHVVNVDKIIARKNVHIIQKMQINQKRKVAVNRAGVQLVGVVVNILVCLMENFVPFHKMDDNPNNWSSCRRLFIISQLILFPRCAGADCVSYLATESLCVYRHC